jgi:hypothetical protein
MQQLVVTHSGDSRQWECAISLGRAGLSPVSTKRGRLQMSIQERVAVEQRDAGTDRFVAARRAYTYALLDDADHEVFAYHWHPHEQIKFPHLHIGAGGGTLRAELHRAHLPTGAIAINDFLLTTIRDFGVLTRRPDYLAVLEASPD